ncbi:P-loop containing nucleoside triphosphatehydrolases superfamily protein [Striga asiatica]|uniref:P-loop containing nucleoside triphosphatehydrolases superfamily protein n=1 Tax=Striga asiatica TaxID=4170 RepID=A0A5A7P8A3_STRAF|nr:P-loop containing nucleoside triphosphatehydrolases superfamily protein [Striga asiatica]
MQKARDRASKKWKSSVICPRVDKIVQENLQNIPDSMVLNFLLTYPVGPVAVGSGISLEFLDFVDRCYYVDTYKAVYASILMPMNGRDQWPMSNFIPAKPPNFGRGAGRPTTTRRLEPDEVVPKEKKRRRRQKCVDPHKIPRQKSVITCSNCGAKGEKSSRTEFASQLTQEDNLPPTPQFHENTTTEFTSQVTQEEVIPPPTPQVPKTSIPNPKKPSKKPSNPNQHIAIQDGALHEATQEQPPNIWDQLQSQQNNEPGASSAYNMKPQKYVTFSDLNTCLAKQSTKMGILLFQQSILIFKKVLDDICSTSRNWGIFQAKKSTPSFSSHRQSGETLELLIDEDMQLFRLSD